MPVTKNTRMLLIATRNPGKLRELRILLAGTPYECISLDDAGINEEVPETGQSFEENAIIKATEYARLSGLLTLADDSGLEVDALDGEPGIRSARYAGNHASDADRIDLLIRKLSKIPDNKLTARFRCVIAVVSPGSDPEIYEGTCEGRIVRSPRGNGGFGYDPVFLSVELDKTMAELSPDEKNRYSHRSIASQKVCEYLNMRVAE